MEEERELYMSELPEREADYHARLTQWKASREMRVREGGREGGREWGGREGTKYPKLIFNIA